MGLNGVGQNELFPRRYHKEATLSLPMVTKGKPELGRWGLLIVDRGQVRLMILTEHFRMRYITPVAIYLPAFRERSQRNAGIILDNDAAVVQKKIAHPGESFGMHQVGGGFQQAVPWPLSCTPL